MSTYLLEKFCSVFRLKINILFFGAFFVLLLSSCEHLKQSRKQETLIQDISWEAHKQRLEEIDHWHVLGKLGFTFPHEGKQRLVSANMDWQKKDSGFDMALSGPLGMGEFTIEKKVDITRLTNHKGDVYEAASPEQLFYQHTGMSIPWSDLEWWVLGIPAPGKAHKLEFESEQTALPTSLLQSGWTVQFLNYQVWKGDALPQKIKFTNGEIKATLIARDWELR